MTSSVTVPAVYVGTYHQYNGGSIFGKWFDLTDFDDEDGYMTPAGRLHAAEDEPPSLCSRTGKGSVSVASESSVKWAIEAFRQAWRRTTGAQPRCGLGEYTGECDYDAFDDAYCGS